MTSVLSLESDDDIDVSAQYKSVILLLPKQINLLNCHNCGSLKVEKSLIQFHKRKIPSTEKIVYHFFKTRKYPDVM